MVLPRVLPSEKRQTNISALCESRDRWLTGFFVSALAGVCSGIAGLIIGGLFLFGFLTQNKTLDRLETWMLILAFPLFIFAAHSLDKVAAAKKAINSIGYKEQK